MEDTLKEIMQKLTKMEVRDTRIEEKLDGFQVEILNLKKENQELKQQNKKLLDKLEYQDSRIEILEKQERKKNIVIYGINETTDETDTNVKEKIAEVMKKMEIPIDIKEDIVEVTRLGMPMTNRVRPIRVELKKNNTKEEIMRKTKKLKGSTIYVNEDFPKEIQIQRKALIQHLKEARANGDKAILKYNKLIINGVEYKEEKYKIRNKAINEEIKLNKNKEVVEKFGARIHSERSPTEEADKDNRSKKIKVLSNTGAISKNFQL